MSYHARKQGLDAWKLAVAREQWTCFICGHEGKPGESRYIASQGKRVPLCCDCLKCWDKEGGALGKISRAKQS